MLDPVIKVRHKLKMQKPRQNSDIKMSLVIFMLLGAFAGNFQFTSAICDKSPDKSVTTAPKQSGNGGFAIGIVGTPRLYRPEQQYIITLEGTAEAPDEKPRFTNFFLAAEPVSTSPNNPTPMGTMQIVSGDAMVMYSGKCRNSVKESSSSMKDQIEVYWTAPKEEELIEGSSGCIEFRAMVIERQDVWYMNDGALTYEICRDTSFVPPLHVQEEIPICTACNEAKYELIFEGIWSRHTHPKDFPVDEWRTQFSKLIGASHSNPTVQRGGRPRSGYSLWSYGEEASLALGYLATFGVTRKLESQMKQFSGDIRSVIKARGLEQRSNVAGQTFAVFRVDSNHHLLSFVTKMIPSPDWIVGVSNENLCLPNGSWTDHRTIDLYPADAGVDSGLKYDSPNQPTRPPQLIQRITSSNPDNPESPFWDINRTPMKPVARLHLIKQREYEKRCPFRQGGNGIVPRVGNPSIGMYNQGGSEDGEGPYVVQQGPGIGEIANEESYPGPSEDIYNDPSTGSEYNGYGGVDQYGGLEDDSPCKTTEWTYWSPCTHTCGKNGNSQSRTRKFMNPRKAARNSCGTAPMEKQPCRHLEDCPSQNFGRTFNAFPETNDDNNMNDYSSIWSRRGLESGNQVRPPVPGNRPSYVYPPAPEDTGESWQGNNQQSWPRGGGQPRYEYPRYNGRGRGNMRQGMYGPGGGSRYSSNNDYSTQPYSYSYGGGGRSNQPEIISDLPQQARYQSRPQGDRSAPNPEPNCQVSDWGEWSECSSSCDEGSRTRNRDYSSRNLSGNCTNELTQHIGCIGNGPNCPGRYPTSRLGFGSYGSSRSRNAVKAIADASEECATADWSDWSPCSKNCINEQGNQKRTRLYTKPFVDGPRTCEVALIESQICWGDVSCPTFDQQNYRNDQNYMEFEPLEDDNQMYPDTLPNDVDKCSQEMSAGDSRCISNYIRWYYDSITGECTDFSFTGCGGNQNNFKSKEICMATCSQDQGNGILDENEVPEVNTMRVLDIESDNNGLVSENLIRLTPEQEDSGVFNPPRLGRPPKPTDCQASAWSSWTACSKSCGTGWTTRDREVLVEAGPDGRACPRKLHRKRKCRQMPCPANTKYWYQGSWRHIGQD